MTPAGRKAVDMEFPGAMPNVPTIAVGLCRRSNGEECTICRDICPLGEGIVIYDRQEREVELHVGGIVVAVGADCGNGSQLVGCLGSPLDTMGNFKAAHPGLDPVRGLLRGIYLAGACAGGYGVGQAALQGLAAAGAALADLLPDGVVELDGPVAVIMTQRCSGCRICLGLCPYQAIEVDAAGRCVINDVLCRGCGACSAACPAGALKLQQYTREQLEAELKGLLDHEPA
jgi:heterodisulfide reductase subunit A